MAEVATIVPVGAGRLANLELVLNCLRSQTVATRVVVVEDGEGALEGARIGGFDPDRLVHVQTPKHMPGMEQPRNIGVRIARETWPETTHAWFVDSDVIMEKSCLEELLDGLSRGPEDRVVIAPYDWLQPGMRPGVAFAELGVEYHEQETDLRWPMFRASPPEKVYKEDLSAGLACFSGNLLWPVSEFERVGGFWNELHHGRCEDGELGVRAVAMDVGISLQSTARGWHLFHDIDVDRVFTANQRDVPMLNARHPWIEGSDVFMVDRDGKAFDVRCPHCGQTVPTAGWWEHAEGCGGMAIYAEVPLETGC